MADIKKVQEGMTGAEAAQLLYDNDSSTAQQVGDVTRALTKNSAAFLNWEQGGINDRGVEIGSTDPNYAFGIRTPAPPVAIALSSITMNCNTEYGYHIFVYDSAGVFKTSRKFDAGGQNTFTALSTDDTYRFSLVRANRRPISPYDAKDANFTIIGYVQDIYLPAADREYVDKNLEKIYGALPSELTGEIPWLNGKYYTATGDLMSNENWDYATYDVEKFAGKKLFYHGYSEGGLAFCLFTDARNNIIGRFQTDAGYYEGTIPPGTKYIKLSNLVDDYPYPQLKIVGNPLDRVSSEWYVDMAIGDYNDVVTKYVDNAVQRNNLAGKKVAFIGDDLSMFSTGYVKTFTDIYGCRFSLLSMTGSCIAAHPTNGSDPHQFVKRATANNLADCSLIVVFGGTNDFSYDKKVIGDLFVYEDITPSNRIGGKKITAPTDTEAFGAALHELINTIRTNAPAVPLMFIAPPPRGRYQEGIPTSNEANKNGDFLSDFVDAIKRICGHYAIPVLDLNEVGGFDFTNPEIAAKYSTNNWLFNKLGNVLMANVLYRFVEQNIAIK